jgi:peptide/nickel transport system ATP-binding protein
MPALRVQDLGVTIGADRTPLLDGVSFSLARGASVGLVGGSGAGKSTLGLALMRLLPRSARLHPASSVEMDGTDLLRLTREQMRAQRGRRIAMVFQEPLQSLNPSMRVGEQLVEALEAHGLARGREAADRAAAMLARVGLPHGDRAARMFPHEFSGGMRQRLLIATSLLLAPDVLIADEPTTALDPTVQAEVLDLLDALRAETGTALLLISHDLDVVGERCERILVLDGGRIVEEGPASQVIGAPRAPATRALAAARRGIASPVAPRTALHEPAERLLDVRALTVRYPLRRRGDDPHAQVHAVESVSLGVARGESVGLVGESGGGKTSLAHAILRLAPATGQALLGGVDLLTLRGEALRGMRRRLQLVPQDAGASLTPHMSAGALVAEAMEVHGIAHGASARGRAVALLAELGLPGRAADALPRELSTGERQRVAIARALATEPELLLCDEPVASVDAPTRMMLLELLDRLRRERRLALLFISHDFAAVARVTSRVAVMYLGRIVETGDTATVLTRPRMPYTQALLSAVPTGDPAGRSRRIVVRGDAPSPVDPPPGCPFFARCFHPLKDETCRNVTPPLEAREPHHLAACWKQDHPVTRITGITP